MIGSLWLATAVAQTAQPGAKSGLSGWQAVLWIGFFLACLVIGGGAIHLLRRYLKNPGRRPPGPSLTLTQVREMRERGEISEGEYRALRRIVAAEYEPPPTPNNTSSV